MYLRKKKLITKIKRQKNSKCVDVFLRNIHARENFLLLNILLLLLLHVCYIVDIHIYITYKLIQ